MNVGEAQALTKASKFSDKNLLNFLLEENGLSNKNSIPYVSIENACHHGFNETEFNFIDDWIRNATNIFDLRNPAEEKNMVMYEAASSAMYYKLFLEQIKDHFENLGFKFEYKRIKTGEYNFDDIKFSISWY